ncbi:DUF6879 family protein [Jiangella alkaliphila]|uniref:DUF6879 domain-containing protein n=1 Tax=Jiangella alkaliphila TaxID=419479 RepID=A0A1H2L8P8_9ACTN|nr:DUF6879 family protein [Jiangella alkaliphila]SDU77085.1 hypothetical protein SAMN04488563_5414 [Jiangella alkaliphila]
MTWLSNEERAGLFDTFDFDAFHLEMRDVYVVEDEVEPQRKWRAGEWTDAEAAEWWEPWLAKMRRASATGRTVRRLRIVTEPISDYTRFLWEGTRFNVSAGEDVRWLPRDQVPPDVVLPPEDLWLFDDERLIFNHFDEASQSMRMERVDDAAMIKFVVAARDRLWPLAVRHAEYQPR